MEATTAKDFCKDITRRCYTLAGCASDSYSERLPHTDHPSRSRDLHFQCLGTSDSSVEQGFYVVIEGTSSADGF
jgi:hypothetical protein